MSHCLLCSFPTWEACKYFIPKSSMKHLNKLDLTFEKGGKVNAALLEVFCSWKVKAGGRIWISRKASASSWIRRPSTSQSAEHSRIRHLSSTPARTHVKSAATSALALLISSSAPPAGSRNRVQARDGEPCGSPAAVQDLFTLKNPWQKINK